MKKIITIIIILAFICGMMTGCSTENNLLYKNISDFPYYHEEEVVFEYSNENYSVYYSALEIGLEAYEFIKDNDKWKSHYRNGKVNDTYYIHLSIPERDIKNINSAYMIKNNTIIQPLKQKLISCNEEQYLIVLFEIPINNYGKYEYKFLDIDGNNLDYIFTKSYNNFGTEIMELITYNNVYKYEFKSNYKESQQIVNKIINSYNEKEYIETPYKESNWKWEISYTGYNLFSTINESLAEFSLQNVKITLKWIEENKYICLEEIYDGENVIKQSYYECDVNFDHEIIENFFINNQ